MSLVVYRLLLPIYLAVALPGWLLRMGRRGGFGTPLLERFGRFDGPLEFEPCGATHVHAVSVGETLLALKLIDAWRRRDPDRRFVLAVATATGHALAAARQDAVLRVIYQPVDLKVCVRSCFNRFEPRQLVLVEGEMWPNLMLECERRRVPVALVNARMSPRSRRRYRRFANWVRPVFSRLDRVAVQEEDDAAIWSDLGVGTARVRCTGSLKFDPGDGPAPQSREAFQQMLDTCRAGRPVVLAASTHAGEEALIAKAVQAAGGFPLIVPRHAERRAAVRADLEAGGFQVALRSAFVAPAGGRPVALVIDTTGELRDWTAHADVVVVGKSFLAEGGQNPAEAVSAGKPLVFGPHMENFEPLATNMVEAGGAWRLASAGVLADALGRILGGGDAPDPGKAREVLARHRGATARTIDWLEAMSSE
jgi:3-deoxy-D-manno-octulosonic-acid transferase